MIRNLVIQECVIFVSKYDVVKYEERNQINQIKSNQTIFISLMNITIINTIYMEEIVPTWEKSCRAISRIIHKQ